MMDNTGPTPRADLVLCNARVITMDEKVPYAEAVAIKGKRILTVCSTHELGLLRGPTTRLIDCEGGTVVPGFNDAHCHPLSFALSLLSVDCSPRVARSIADIQARIRHRADQMKEGGWVRAANYDESYLAERRPPTRWELDEASPGHPVVLVHNTEGACVLNSLALRIAGIGGNTSESVGGVVHRDTVTGEPNGLVTGRDERVVRAIPPVTEEELEEGMRLANQEYVSHGITSLQDTGWNNGWRNWLAWERLINRGGVAPRVSMLVGTESLDEFQEAGLSMGNGDEWLRLGGFKLALDESTGCPHPPQEDVNRLALRACRAGFQVAFHVSDVYTLRASLTAIEFLSQMLPDSEPRFRVEHCAICPPALLLRLKARGVIVVTQPSFLAYMGQKYQDLVSSHQAGWLWPIGSLRRWGARVAFSSDSPLVNSDPLTGIYAAVSRKTETDQRLAPQECVSTLEALEMYTLMGACASGEETIKGSISPGKLADITVLSGDLRHLSPERLTEIKVVRTIIGGKVVWER